MFRSVTRDSVREMKGARATVFMIETSRCLHMGSRMAPGHHRLLYTATYIQPPRIYPEPPARFRAVGPLNEIERTAMRL